MIKVLFVCLGNICRSPLAEGIFNDLLKNEQLQDKVQVDSAGTGTWHIGELPDLRTINVARQHGIELTSPARQVQEDDLNEFDYILAMDLQNLDDINNLKELSPGKAKVFLMRDFDRPAKADKEVPDPYLGEDGQFDVIYNILEHSCKGFLEFLRKQEKL